MTIILGIIINLDITIAIYCNKLTDFINEMMYILISDIIIKT